MLDLCKFLSWFRRDYFFSLGKTQYYGFWIHILARSSNLKLKTWIWLLQTRSFSLHQTLIDGLEWCGLLVDYYYVFTSSHSDGTHSLQSIHWWASDVMLHFSKSDEETNSSTSWKVWGWVQFQRILIFGWTSPMIFITQLNWRWWALIAAQERAAQGRTV